MANRVSLLVERFRQNKMFQIIIKCLFACFIVWFYDVNFRKDIGHDRGGQRVYA